MKRALSLTSRIREAGNAFIIEKLKECGYKGISPSHGDILVVLYTSDTESCAMKEIADKIHRTKATVTVLVDKLEQLGFVKREKSSQDSRITNIILTKQGKDLKPVFDKISDELNAKLYGGFKSDEIKLLDDLLEKMLNNL